jgi:hypothetical protein
MELQTGTSGQVKLHRAARTNLARRTRKPVIAGAAARSAVQAAPPEQPWLLVGHPARRVLTLLREERAHLPPPGTRLDNLARLCHFARSAGLAALELLQLANIAREDVAEYEDVRAFVMWDVALHRHRAALKRLASVAGHWTRCPRTRWCDLIGGSALEIVSQVAERVAGISSGMLGSDRRDRALMMRDMRSPEVVQWYAQTLAHLRGDEKLRSLSERPALAAYELSYHLCEELREAVLAAQRAPEPELYYLRVDVDRELAIFDGQRYFLSSREQALVLKRLLEHEGCFVTSRELMSYPENTPESTERPGRLIARLPAPIKERIEGVPSRGFRLNLYRDSRPSRAA